MISSLRCGGIASSFVSHAGWSFTAGSNDDIACLESELSFLPPEAMLRLYAATTLPPSRDSRCLGMRRPLLLRSAPLSSYLCPLLPSHPPTSRPLGFFFCDKVFLSCSQAAYFFSSFRRLLSSYCPRRLKSIRDQSSRASTINCAAPPAFSQSDRSLSRARH